MPTSELLLVGDAARDVDKTPATIRSWIKSGRLQVQRTRGGVAIISPAELKKAAEARNDDGPAAA